MQYDEHTEQQMFDMIASWKQSGLSQKQYCEQNNIRYYVFHYWYKRYRDSTTTAMSKDFVPLKVQSSPSLPPGGAHMELLLADGKRILFHQPVSSDYLKAIIS